MDKGGGGDQGVAKLDGAERGKCAALFGDRSVYHKGSGAIGRDDFIVEPGAKDVAETRIAFLGEDCALLKLKQSYC